MLLLPQQIPDPARAFLCIPLDLVLDSSFIEDSDGGTLYVRLLAPPSQQSSALLPFAKVKSAASAVVATDHALGPVSRDDLLSAKNRAERLRTHVVDGSCKKLRLVKVEARTSNSDQARQWVKELMRRAYPDVQPYRRLKVLINPVGGPGKARQLFQAKIRPILEAAGCRLDVQVTERVNHGLEIAKTLNLDNYDALLLVSGDGLAHEVLNGFAQRSDATKALHMPMCPIPTGSGNGLCVNLLGPEQGFNLVLASLNAIKGKALPLDICVVTQPRATGRGTDRPQRAAGKAARGRRPEPVVEATSTDADPVALSEAPELPFEQYYSFLSQAIGLMADVDLGTEHLRALGDTRFILGYISGIIANNECPVDIDVKLGQQGTKNKEDMRHRTSKFNARGQWASSERGDAGRTGQGEASSSAMPPLRHGTVSDPLFAVDTTPPLLSATDPSWPHSILNESNGADAEPTSEDPPPNTWARLSAPVATLYAGKIPFVARDLLQFPYALPGDGTVDIALMLHQGGRASKLRAINGAETGVVVYDRAVVYLKVEAYRVTPKLSAGDPRLKKGGLVSIDGEHRPYAPFQVEVSTAQATTLSLFGRFNVQEVPAPSPMTLQ